MRADPPALPCSIVMPKPRPLRRNWFPISAGLICFAWAFLAWLTVIPNQDLLADGIQVQSLIQDPRILLSFPGQKHGGIIEYPFNVLAEWIAPGNYFLHSALRPIFAFLTGLFAAKLYLTYFTRAPRWSFLLAMAVGPTVLHGLAGPEGNPVGVWWLNANYDLAWLFVIVGFWLLGREVSPPPAPRTEQPRSWMFLVTGIVIGLGFYQQPTAIMLIIPMAVLFLLRFRISIRHLFTLLIGGAIGIIPSILSYFFTPVTTWNPSHFPVFQPQLALASLGLDGIPNYVIAILPSALGFGPVTSIGAGKLQTAVTAVFLTAMFVGSVIGSIAAFRRRNRVSVGTAIAITWLAVAAGIVLFGIVVDPVWFYSAHLAIILWMSIGIIPLLFSRRGIGVLIAVGAASAVAYCTLLQNAAWYVSTDQHISDKREYLSVISQYAEEIEDSKTKYVYGSYYDVLPIGYGSGGSLHAISSTYDRFPVADSELSGKTRINVAVRIDPTDDWGNESLKRVQSSCASTTDIIRGDLGTFEVFECPISVFQGA